VSGHIIAQRQSDMAQFANMRLALIKKSQFEKMCIPFVRMVARHSQRVTEEANQLLRPRNLFEDNPTSG
jgi:hypothetical protein